MRHRIDVLHGINLDVLGRRPAAHYGGLTLGQLEVQVKRYADELELAVTFSQTNHEGEYCEALHNAAGDGLILNPGAWTHYSWAIRDALEVTGLPAVEVHLSAVDEREEWRRVSVIRDLCVGAVQGQGPEGYREALALLRERLGE
jgi:3-dehydroquinate dehydratase II